MANLPPVVLDNAVDPADQATAIDFINRVNWLFDAWDIDAMVEAFLPDAVTYHTHGISRGRWETRRFFQQMSSYSAPGVSRHATNPIVDRDGQGVVVRYYNLLVRYGSTAPSGKIVAGQVISDPDNLPAIWIHSAMTDRLRRTDTGWRIFERYVGQTTMNDGLGPLACAPARFEPYRPWASAL